MNGLAIILGSGAVGRLSERFGERRLLRVAVVTAVAATSVVLATAFAQGPLVLLVVPIFVYMGCMGMILTSSFALAMEGQENRAGSASSLLGALPMFVGALVAPLVGLDETTAVPMGLLLFGSSALGLLVMVTMTRPPARSAVPESDPLP